jgi:hypothetical protein
MPYTRESNEWQYFVFSRPGAMGRSSLPRQLLGLYIPGDFRASASARIHRSHGGRWHVARGGRDLGIEAYGLDLHSGFNILKQRILEVVGKPSDLVLSHPPYHNIVVYSRNVWGRAAHPDDLSRCEKEEEFVEKLTVALKNQRHATRAGGYYGAIIGDIRRGGAYSSFQADLHCANAEKGIAGGANQATAQRRQQRQGLPAKAAAHHARICDLVAASAHGRGDAAKK